MSDEKALLAAIWEYPHEDTPRLVYADWLDEHEQPERAEFIRVQCERARLDEWDDAERIEHLKEREAELWKAHGNAWKAALPPKVRTATFRRGFVYPRRLGFGGAAFLKLKRNAFDAAPQWAVTVRSFVRQFDKLFASPLLLRFNELAIESYKYPHDVLEKLAGNDRLRNVTDLTVNTDESTPASVAAFFGGPAAAAVSRLGVGYFDAERFAALAASPVAARLRYFNVYIHGHPAPGVLFGAKNFPRLWSLDLRGAHVGAPEKSAKRGEEEDRLDRLFTGEPTTQLRKLDLSHSVLTDAGAKHLAAWPGLAQLRWLDVGGNLITEVGYRAIARSPHVGNLRYLNVDRYDLERLPKAKAALEARFGSVLHYE